jgi:hypothetical protein
MASDPVPLTTVDAQSMGKAVVPGALDFNSKVELPQ